MLKIGEKLKILEEKHEQINICLIGAGMMGKLIVSQTALMKGMKVSVIADCKVDRAVEAYKIAGVSSDDIVIAKTIESIDDAIKDGKSVVTENAETASSVPSINAVVDATGVPEVGARVALNAINNKKHVITLNKEADITVGPILKRFADLAGVIYTGSAGDEPGAIMELYDFASTLGMEVVVAGKGKNNPFDKEATPESLASEAASKGLNPKILTSFVDGTNTMIEMAEVANASGLVPDVRGMHGPTATVKDLPKVFCLTKDGGILQNVGVVDYAMGIAPGVFLVVTTDQEEIKKGLEYLAMGKGPNYVFFRPYHLPGIETPLSVARAVIYKEPTIAPIGEPKAEVITVAKKDLKPGQVLDGIGGFTVYGVIEKVEIAREEDALPIGLADGAIIKKSVTKGEIIRYDMVELNEDLAVVHLRRLQDRIFK